MPIGYFFIDSMHFLHTKEVKKKTREEFCDRNGSKCRRPQGDMQVFPSLSSPLFYQKEENPATSSLYDILDVLTAKMTTEDFIIITLRTVLSPQVHLLQNYFLVNTSSLFTIKISLTTFGNSFTMFLVISSMDGCISLSEVP